MHANDDEQREEGWQKLLEEIKETGIPYEVFDDARQISREIEIRSNLERLLYKSLIIVIYIYESL